MMTILDEEELVASAVVYPGSTEEVQQIVHWANKYRIPIFPISMGRNCLLSHHVPSIDILIGKLIPTNSRIRRSCTPSTRFRDG